MVLHRNPSGRWEDWTPSKKHKHYSIESTARGGPARDEEWREITERPSAVAFLLLTVQLTVTSLHIRSALFILQEKIDSAQIELLPGMGAIKIWRMGDKVRDICEKVKLWGNSGWKDSSGVEETWIWLR